MEQKMRKMLLKSWYCYVEIPKEDNRILKCNHGEKYMKVRFIIYADLESLVEKRITCHNNLKKTSTTKIRKHTPSGYLLFKHCLFNTTKHKLDCCRGKDCMKNVSRHLKNMKHKQQTMEEKKWYYSQLMKANLIKTKTSVIYAKNYWWWQYSIVTMDYCHYSR